MGEVQSADEKLRCFLKINWPFLLGFFLSVLALALRLVLFSYESADYKAFLQPWVAYLAQHGHFSGLAGLSSDYASPYLLLLGFISYLPNSLGFIKFFSCLLDFASAGIAGLILKKVTGKRHAALAGYVAFLFTPTIWLNSAMWGQCDIFYTFFLLLALLCFLCEKPSFAWACFGFAFAFKLQAVFLLPFMAILYLEGRGRLRDILFAPAAFLLANVPGWLVGIPVLRTFQVYFQQAGSYQKRLSWNATSLYGFMSDASSAPLAKAGVVFALAAMALFAFYVIYSGKVFDAPLVLLLFLASALVTPYLLPYMHERYFFAAEAAVVLYCLCRPKVWWLCPLILLPSCGTYFRYLVDGQAFSLPVLTFFFTLGVAAVIWLLFSEISNAPKLTQRFPGAQKSKI